MNGAASEQEQSWDSPSGAAAATARQQQQIATRRACREGAMAAKWHRRARGNDEFAVLRVHEGSRRQAGAGG